MEISMAAITRHAMSEKSIGAPMARGSKAHCNHACLLPAS